MFTEREMHHGLQETQTPFTLAVQKRTIIYRKCWLFCRVYVIALLKMTGYDQILNLNHNIHISIYKNKFQTYLI